MIELRCRFKKAAELDPENLRLVVLCRSCSHRQKHPVYHEWHLAEIMAMVAEGYSSGVLAPDGPRFVQWRVV